MVGISDDKMLFKKGKIQSNCEGEEKYYAEDKN
jgi:hypothetical protein